MTSNAYATEDARWKALSTRDKAATNSFLYAVRTTKIYCRPNCPSRLARRSNIIYFDSIAEAEAADFRPCKRCKPDVGQQLELDPIQKTIKRAVEIVKEEADNGKKISLAELSKRTGVSKWHLQRVFRRTNGLTPHQMATAAMAKPSNGRDSGVNTPSSASVNTSGQCDQTADSPLPRSGTVSSDSGVEMEPEALATFQRQDFNMPYDNDFEIESWQATFDPEFASQHLVYTPDQHMSETDLAWLEDANLDELIYDTVLGRSGSDFAMNAAPESHDPNAIGNMTQWQMHNFPYVEDVDSPHSARSSYPMHQESDNILFNQPFARDYRMHM